MRTLTCWAGEGFAEIELVRESLKGEIMRLIAKHWKWITCVGTECPVDQCYKWQEGSTSMRSWSEDLEKELDSISADTRLAELTGT
jgi:hypothetical protein